MSAAADNDPTTVATLAVTGATVVYGLEWVLLLIIPMFAIVQAIATQVATVTRRGMQSVIAHRYGRTIALVSLLSIAAVNLITYAADLEAGAAAISLLTHVRYEWFLVPLTVLIGLLLAFGSMDRIRRVLLIFPIAFVAYVFAAFLAHPVWGDVARGFIPHFQTDSDHISATIALIGTALTTYSYYWQTVEVADERPPRRAVAFLQLSSLPGTLLTGAILWFILIGTAATLGVHHKSVDTAQDAAMALAPFAGPWATTIFGIGLLGSALLALPVIAAGTANAVAATFSWSGNLNQNPIQAKRYYATVFILMATATAFTFLNIRPISLLFAASIAAGFATPITLVLLVLAARDAHTMRHQRISLPLAVGGWTVAALITLAALAFVRWH